MLAGTPAHVVEDLFLTLPSLQRLVVKGSKFEPQAVSNLLRLQKRVALARSRLLIETDESL